jgi:hypothetical protein
VLERVGPIAYQLALPTSIKVHNVFHISLLKKYVCDATHVVDWDAIQVELEQEFPVEPERILDRRDLILWNCTIEQVKVKWMHLSPEEATWELESHMRDAYLILFREDSKKLE